MVAFPLKPKLVAAGLHLSVSLVIFIPLLWLLLYRWYPGPLFVTDGGWQGLRLMVLVDLVLGPTLMFLAYNPLKAWRERVVDISVIAVIQLAALVYGYVAVESKRPVLVAFHDGRFYAVTKDRFKPQAPNPEDWERLGERPPYWTVVRQPQSDDEKAGVLTYELVEGLAQWELLYLQEPLAETMEAIKTAAVPLQELQDKADLQAELKELEREAGRSLRDLYLVRLEGYFRPALVALDEQGRYHGAVYLPPPDA